MWLLWFSTAVCDIRRLIDFKTIRYELHIPTRQYAIVGTDSAPGTNGVSHINTQVKWRLRYLRVTDSSVCLVYGQLLLPVEACRQGGQSSAGEKASVPPGRSGDCHGEPIRLPTLSGTGVLTYRNISRHGDTGIAGSVQAVVHSTPPKRSFLREALGICYVGGRGGTDCRRTLWIVERLNQLHKLQTLTIRRRSL